MGKRIFERWVDDQLVQVEVDRNRLLRATSNATLDANLVADHIGLISELLGDYMRRVALNDAQYRHWRGQAESAQLEADPKLPEWKVKAKVEGDPAFLAFKSEGAELKGDLEYLNGIFEALRAKGFMVTVRKDLQRTKEQGESS